MVKALHQVGIEVILDVVYNHSAEGNHLGPLLSFKASTTAPITISTLQIALTTSISPAPATP